MPITVDCDYPGGNIMLRQIDGSRIVVTQDQRDTEEWWFWWNFRVRGAAGRTLHVEFDNPRGGPVGPNGPVMSTDRREWRWARQADGGGPCKAFDNVHFVVAVPPAADEVFFAFSFPYQLADLERFIEARRSHPDFRATLLVGTRKGRRAPLLVIGDPASAEQNVVFSCRHHACESVAAFVLEGVIDLLLSAEGAPLRRTTAFTIAPAVDLDGVEDGDQGKARVPHDHGRDYIDAPLYPTVRAMKAVVDDLAGRNLRLAVDFHCPWIRRDNNESTFLVEPPEPYAARVREFGAILREVNDSPIPYTGKMDVPFGTSWNVPTPDGVSLGRYVRSRDTGRLLASFTLETSYSLSEGAVVTPDAVRRFGRCFGRAITRYLDRRR